MCSNEQVKKDKYKEQRERERESYLAAILFLKGCEKVQSRTKRARGECWWHFTTETATEIEFNNKPNNRDDNESDVDDIWGGKKGRGAGNVNLELKIVYENEK